MKRNELRTEWEHRIANYISSGQSAANWCSANEINIHQFWYWKKKLKTTQKAVTETSRWLGFELEDSIEDSRSKLVVKVGRASLEVKQGFDPKLLADVVWTLQSIC